MEREEITAKISMSVVGRNLKALREAMGLGQKHVAAYLGVDQSLVSKFESGERAISSDMLDRLSVLFCCPISEIVAEQGGEPGLAFVFNTRVLDRGDLETLARISRIAMNQLYMDGLARGAADA